MFLLLFIANCTSNNKSLSIDNDLPMSVDINQVDNSSSSLVIEKSTSAKMVGPEPISNFTNNDNDKNESSINTLLLGPGIYRSFAYLPLLKKLKAEKVPLHIIGGYGLSSVIAAYYAFGYEPDIIEWKIFTKLIKESKPYPYSKKWIESLEQLLEKDFKNKNIEDSKISLFVPEYKNNEVSFATRGNLIKRLKNNFTLGESRSLNRLITTNPCTNKGISRIIQASKIICLNVLDSSLKWLSAKDYILGIYNKASSLMESDPSENKININLKNMELDNLSKQPEILSRSKGQSAEIINKISQILNYN